MAPNPTMPRGVADVGSSVRVSKRRTDRSRAKPLPSPRLKASVKSLAEERPTASPGDSQIDDRILDRIKKCLERANHQNTTESEAKAALFLSQKLMSQYNVTNADLMAKESPDEQGQFAGSSVVSIGKTEEGSTSVQIEGFVSQAASAMTMFFDCQFYTTRKRKSNSVEWTFYGIAQNTVAAARAFEMVFNLISHWTLAYKGKSAKSSYSYGVASGLSLMARKEKQQEAEEARKTEQEILEERVREEERQRMEELARLHRAQSDSHVSDDIWSSGSRTPSPPAGLEEPITGGYDDWDAEEGGNDEAGPGFAFEPDFKEEDGNFIDLTADVDEQIRGLLKHERSPSISLDDIKSETEEKPDMSLKREQSPTGADAAVLRDTADDDEPIRSLWKSELQLVQFRQTAKEVAEDFLKQRQLRLRKARKRYTSIRDGQAYRQGVKDSNKIDVRGKRLE